MTDTQQPQKFETNEDMKITRQEFEAFYYNCEEDIKTHEVFLPIEVAKELNISAKKLDFIHRNLIPLKHAFIDGTHCQVCFRELPQPTVEDRGEGQTELITYCPCGESYRHRY